MLDPLVYIALRAPDIMIGCMRPEEGSGGTNRRPDEPEIDPCDMLDKVRNPELPETSGWPMVTRPLSVLGAICADTGLFAKKPKAITAMQSRAVARAALRAPAALS